MKQKHNRWELARRVADHQSKPVKVNGKVIQAMTFERGTSFVMTDGVSRRENRALTLHLEWANGCDISGYELHEVLENGSGNIDKLNVLIDGVLTEVTDLDIGEDCINVVLGVKLNEPWVQLND